MTAPAPDPARREELAEAVLRIRRAGSIDDAYQIAARWLADARAEAFAAGDEYGYARGRTEVRARVEAVLDRKPHYYAKALENGVRAALADPPTEPAP